jgi:hypothetical protein
MLDLVCQRYQTIDAINDNLAGGMSTLGAGTKLAAHEVQMLGFQFNDMATILANGASPFAVIATQGGEIAQVLGPRGARCAVQALGQAFVGCPSPVNLSIVAAAGVGALVSRFNSGVTPLAGVLEEHEALVRARAGAYRRVRRRGEGG